MDAVQAATVAPWYRNLTREQWRVLLAANIAWTFDGFEIYALFLTVGFALRQLLAVGDVAEVPRFASYVLAATVFGWATGGVIGGIVADYIGRKRAMVLTILAYSLSASGPLIAGTLIVGLGGFGPAATIVGLFFIVGVVVAPFLPETNGRPLPDTLQPSAPLSQAA